jgi:hypothetical protein
MSFFGLLGIARIYARHAEAVGWLGLAGFVVFSLWLVLVTVRNAKMHSQRGVSGD